MRYAMPSASKRCGGAAGRDCGTDGAYMAELADSVPSRRLRAVITFRPTALWCALSRRILREAGAVVGLGTEDAAMSATPCASIAAYDLARGGRGSISRAALQPWAGEPPGRRPHAEAGAARSNAAAASVCGARVMLLAAWRRRAGGLNT